MKLNKKKGFTIVELVIVIAVIAILAAVLIPNISKLVKKANASADESLVRNLNTALAMDTEKHATMSDALKAALDNGGYDVAKIVTKDKDNKILWDSVNDCFVYLKKGDEKPTYIPKTSGTYTEAENYQLFEIVDEVPALADQKYAIYLSGEGKTVESKEVSVGFDAGENTVKSLTYTNTGAAKEDVIIYTNGGTLTVNAANDTVKHYGTSSVVTIENVATKSYHEYGTVGEIKLAAGRVVVEGKAEVGSVLVTAESITGTTTKNVSVEVKSTATLGAVGATTKLEGLAGVVSGTTEVLETAVNNSNFAGGFGTEKAPYLVATAEQFYSISEFFSSISQTAHYFRQVADIEVNQAASKYFSGVYDGNGYAIVAADSVANRDFISLFGIPYANTVIKNVNTYSAEKVALTLTSENWDTLSSLKFININVYAKDGVDLVKTTQANFAYLMFGCAYARSNKQTYEFENCNVYANLYGANRCAAYLGAACYTDNLYIKMRNCVNKANISSPQWASVVVANGYDDMPKSFNENNISQFFDIDETVKNEGIISGNGNGTHSGLVGVEINKNEFTKALHEYAKTIGGKYDVVIEEAKTNVQLYWDNGFKVLGGEAQNLYGLYIGDVTYYVTQVNDNNKHNSRAGGAWVEKVTSVSENATLVSSIKIVSKNDEVISGKEVNYDYVFDGSMKCGFIVIDSQLYCVIDTLQVDANKLRTYLTVFSNGAYVSYSKLG